MPVSVECFIDLKDIVLYIEMKRNAKKLKSGKLSKAGIDVSDKQREFIATVNKSNVVSATVCYGFLEAMDYIKQFLPKEKKVHHKQGALIDVKNPLN